MWIVEAPINWMRRKLWQRRSRHQIRAWLSTLSVEEEELLRGMLRSRQQSTSAEISDPIVARLVHKRLLDRASGVGSVLAWTFTVPPMVWKEMQRRWPEAKLLMGPPP
jgi:hypothetical protein